jgi:CheY-like chemotaxis protein
MSETVEPDAIAHQSLEKLVLVVDDESFILEATAVALLDVGYQVKTAANGRIALEIFDEHASYIDAVVIDLMMPELDGLSTIRALRKRTPDLPIIATSGLGEARAKSASDAGAPVFLSKPFTAAQLYVALDKAFESVKGSR